MAKMLPFSVQCRFQSLREVVQLKAHLKMASHFPIRTSSFISRSVHLPEVRVNMTGGNDILPKEKQTQVNIQTDSRIQLNYTMTIKDGDR